MSRIKIAGIFKSVSHEISGPRCSNEQEEKASLALAVQYCLQQKHKIQTVKPRFLPGFVRSTIVLEHYHLISFRLPLSNESVWVAPTLLMLINIAGVLLTTNQDLGMKTNVKMLQAGPTIISWD